MAIPLVSSAYFPRKIKMASEQSTVNRAAGFRLAARLNEAFRRHCGLGGYAHSSNRIEHEHCMYDALEELGMLPLEDQTHG
jgi:hypothetical protein